MSKILVYGSLNVDYVYEVPHFVQPGETLLSFSRNVFAGGKGLNQAVALARAGGKVSFVGSIGKEDGEILSNTLKTNGIDSLNVAIRDDVPSGHTFIQVDRTGQNCILLFGGANRCNSKANIDEALKGFSADDFLVLQNETNDIDYIIEKASDKGMYVCINTAPFDENIAKLPLDKCNLLIVNEIEGAALAHTDESADPDTIIQKLRSSYPKSSILLTLGAQGSIFAEQGGSDVIRCDALKVEAVDTTAAGDTFLGYFISLRAAGESYEKALKTASAASAIAVTRHGAASSIPYVQEVREYLQNL